METEADPRVSRVRSTQLAVRFLLPRDEADRDDAFDGLTAICWRGKGNYFLQDATHCTVDDADIKPEITTHIRIRSREDGRPKDEDEDTPSTPHAHGQRRRKIVRETIRSATRKFIQIAILEILAPYRGKSRAEIQADAKAGAFAHIPHAVRNRLIDAIRHYCAHHRVEPSIDHLVSSDGTEAEATAADLIRGRDNASSPLGHPVPPAWHQTPENLNRGIERNRTRWVELVGERGFAILATAVNLYAEDAEMAAKDFGGQLTRELSGRLGLSEGRVRAERRRLQHVMSEAREAGNPLVEQLVEIFTAVPDAPRRIDRPIMLWNQDEDEATRAGNRLPTGPDGAPLRVSLGVSLGSSE